MENSKLVEKSKKFAVNCIKFLKEEKFKFSLIDQLIRSSTSIGANIHEAYYASSKADFISKLHIALKECYESEYWFEILIQSDVLDEKYYTLQRDCVEIKRMLISSLNTSKISKN
ncbi:MAG: four helix bundle protein [Clostridiales bacterium]|nr:four helix bundle protein [Clostridiales bacterium]